MLCGNRFNLQRFYINTLCRKQRKNGSLLRFLFGLAPVNDEPFESVKFEGNIVRVHATKAYRIGGLALFIQNIFPTLTWIFSFTLRSLCHGERTCGSYWIVGWMGFSGSLDVSENRNTRKSLATAGIRTPDSPNLRSVTVPNKISGFA
jgi:hypothetical protein